LELANRQVRVERRHRGPDAVAERGRGAAGGAHGDLASLSGFLGHGLVDLVGDRDAIERVDRLDVLDDADDLSPFDGLPTGPGEKMRPSSTRVPTVSK
jgi:hypothetical protein